MSNADIIRAWKDEAFRLTLTEEQLAALPPNPAGQIDLVDADLDVVAGGMNKTKNKGPAFGGPGGGGTGRTSCNCTRSAGCALA
jgi:mersacidin/lichenicidin family type 2 lantibiotic